MEPLLAYLSGRGITPALAARLIGDIAGNPRSGMKQVLGTRRFRRDRVEALAAALDTPFLYELLEEDVWYDRVTRISPSKWKTVYDIEVQEHHTFVTNDIVVANCSPPFRQAEFDIMYGQGISREGSVLDVAVDLGFVKKSGAWYTYEGEQLGQGREKVKEFLGESPELMIELHERIKTAKGIGVPIEIPLGQGIGDDDPISLDNNEPISLNDKP
jgi:recombination protein RecA